MPLSSMISFPASMPPRKPWPNLRWKPLAQCLNGSNSWWAWCLLETLHPIIARFQLQLQWPQVLLFPRSIIMNHQLPLHLCLPWNVQVPHWHIQLLISGWSLSRTILHVRRRLKDFKISFLFFNERHWWFGGPSSPNLRWIDENYSWPQYRHSKASSCICTGWWSCSLGA